MDIRILKLADAKGEEDLRTAMDILSIHLGRFNLMGEVTYSTSVPVASKPDYVLLTLSMDTDICYLCHVKDYDYNSKNGFVPQNQALINASPDKYKGRPEATWLLFDTMQKIPTDFLDSIHPTEQITDFIVDRANNKKIY